MGGKNAITILDDADLKLALEGVLWSAFGTTGQRCTAASRVIVHAAVYDEFASMLVEGAKKLRLGNGLETTTDVGPVVNKPQLEKIASYMPVARDDGATIATGGDLAKGDGLDRGYFFQPTVLLDAKPEMRVAQEEIFGPVTALIKVNSLDEAIEVNNGVKYGLSSSIYTRDVNRAFEAMEGLDTGIVYVNAGTIGAEVHLPFGGVKKSGNGHPSAAGLIEAVTHKTAWTVNHGYEIKMAQGLTTTIEEKS
jgi:aldehyde dehydrogenase (NAD+)